MRLLVTTYLTDRLPPAQLVSSVRAVVTIGRQIVMLRNPDAAHFLPGGRLEVGESYLQALRREVTEETGLNIRGAKQIGFLHLHHLTPEPTVYRCPYPDMIHLVYAAEGSGTLRSGDADGWEARRSGRRATIGDQCAGGTLPRLFVRGRRGRGTFGLRPWMSAMGVPR